MVDHLAICFGRVESVEGAIGSIGESRQLKPAVLDQRLNRLRRGAAVEIAHNDRRQTFSRVSECSHLLAAHQAGRF